MNDLHRAYIALGLEPGSSKESITRRYKRLIMVWHPDRAPTGEHREFAEQELKKINSAKETLTQHFRSGGNHRDGRCECQPSFDESRALEKTTKGSPGPGYHRRKANAGAQGGKSKNSEVMEAPLTVSIKHNVRWMVVGLILIAGAFAVSSNWWRSASVPAQTEPMSTNNNVVSGGFALPSKRQPNTAGVPGSPSRTMPRYPKSSYSGNRAPGPAPRMVRNPVMSQQNRVQFVTILEVDKYEKQIDRCIAELAGIDARLADPTVIESEKRKLLKMQFFQQKNLRIAQANLVIAKGKLTPGGPAPAPMNVEPNRAELWK